MLRRILVGIGAGLVAGILIVQLAGLALGGHRPRGRLVAEDASAPLRRIAIHYAPASDVRALPVWRLLFAALPASVQVDVEVAQPADFDRLLGKLRAAG